MSTTTTILGKIKTIRGLIVTISFASEERPELREVMIVQGHPELILEIQSFNDRGDGVAINMTSSPLIKRGTALESTGLTISVPTGPQTLGRLFNALGQTQDGKPALGPEVPRRSVYKIGGTQEVVGATDA